MNRIPDFEGHRLAPARKTLRNNPEEGQGLVEYAMILMLVVIVVIVILVFLGPQVGNMFSSVTKNMS